MLPRRSLGASHPKIGMVMRKPASTSRIKTTAVHTASQSSCRTKDVQGRVGLSFSTVLLST